MNKSVVRFLFGAIVTIGLLIGSLPAKADDASLWQALKSGGHFVMIRHALAPGTGDPAEFSINDCSTQRNLSDSGRKQAGSIGGKFRGAGIKTASVYTSQWCRCRETAELLKLGEVTDLPTLNSFYEMRENEDRQMRKLRGWIRSQKLDTPTVLVTHFVNIGALTEYYPSSGELVFVRREPEGNLTVIGTIKTPAET